MVAWFIVVAHLRLTVELPQKPLQDLRPVQLRLLPEPSGLLGSRRLCRLLRDISEAHRVGLGQQGSW